MGFRTGAHYPHPPRGKARHPYTRSPAVLRARRANFGKVRRLRTRRETAAIKLVTWQSDFDPEPRPSQRDLDRELGVSRSYFHKAAGPAAARGRIGTGGARLAARHLGPATGWVWLAGGGLIAAALERLFLLPIDFFQVHEVAGVSYLLGGPAYLRNMWWLVIPSGIVTAMICYELYPWSFQRSR